VPFIEASLAFESKRTGWGKDVDGGDIGANGGKRSGGQKNDGKISRV